MFNLKYLFIALLCLCLCGCGRYQENEKIQFLLNNKIYEGIVQKNSSIFIKNTESDTPVNIAFVNDIGKIETIIFTHKQLVQMKNEIQQRINTVIEK